MGEPVAPPAPETGSPRQRYFERVEESVGHDIFVRNWFLFNLQHRWSRLAILDGSDIPLNEREGIDFYKLKPDELRDLSTRGKGRPIIILVEDINRDCVELLDAAFGLDPIFLLASERGVAASQDALPNEFQDLSNRLREAGSFASSSDRTAWTVRIGNTSLKPSVSRFDMSFRSPFSRGTTVAAYSWPASKTRK